MQVHCVILLVLPRLRMVVFLVGNNSLRLEISPDIAAQVATLGDPQLLKTVSAPEMIFNGKEIPKLIICRLFPCICCDVSESENLLDSSFWRSHSANDFLNSHYLFTWFCIDIVRYLSLLSHECSLIGSCVHTNGIYCECQLMPSSDP